MLDLTPLLSAIIPTLVGLITAQRLPDEIVPVKAEPSSAPERSEEHTSELQSH